MGRFWSALESLPGLSGVRAEWQQLMGSDFRWGRRFLMRTGSLALSYPARIGPPYEVIRMHDGTFRGVRDPQEEVVTLASEDLVVYSLNLTQLASEIAEALSADSLDRPAVLDHGCAQIGIVRARPAYLVIATEDDEMSIAMDRVARCVTGPFIVASPTLRWLGELRPLLTAIHGALLDLSAALELRKETLLLRPGALDGIGSSSCPVPAEPELLARLQKLNDMERHILIALHEHGIFRSDHPNIPSQTRLAGWTGYECNTTFKVALSTLGKAGYIDNNQHTGGRGGYFLLPLGCAAGELLRRS